jgi:GDP-L-fucose synthase
MRDFLHVNDMADAVVFALEKTESLYKIGSEFELTIKELAELIQKIIGNTGKILWDSSKPVGTPGKLMDVSKIKNAGWKSKIGLEDGIKWTYNWFLENKENTKKITF